MKKAKKVIIRVGYCPPNPGPKVKTGCLWFSEMEQAIEYCEKHPNEKHFLYIKTRSIYEKISYEELLKLYNNDKTKNT